MRRSRKMDTNDNPELDTSWTILDILNADCWRHVLDYLSINDVVRSECVSRGWQQVVLGYLPGVKSYRIHYYSWCGTFMHYRNQHRYRCIYLDWDKTMFQSMINKMGPYIEKLLLYSTNLGYFSPSFSAHCPNVEDITLFGIDWEIPFKALKYFTRLKKVTFESCARVKSDSEHKSGRFLAFVGKNLTSLTLNACPLLKIEGLDQSEDFSRLTELVLNNSPEVFAKASQLIRKAPKLEILSLDGYYTEVSVHEDLVAAIGRLSELKRFRMSRIATDALLEAIANGCKKLRYLNINGSSAVNWRAVRALCRELPCLTELHVAGSQVSDEDLVDYIRYSTITENKEMGSILDGFLAGPVTYGST